MKTVLLVESDSASRCVIEVHLRKDGYTVVSVADGAEALEKFEATAPDVVVAGTQLPTIDGFELVRRLRQNASNAELPVILLASDAELGERKRALDLGVEEYLTKPVYLRELTARVQFLLARRARQSMEETALALPGHSRPTGSTRDLALVDIIRSFEAAGKSGIVRLRNGMHEAHVYFRDGRVVDADLGPLRAEAAIYRALLWDEASFEVEFTPVSKEDTLGCSTQALVMTGMRRVDEWVRLCTQVKPLAALLDIHPPQLLDRLNTMAEIPDGLKAMFPSGQSPEAQLALAASTPALAAATAAAAPPASEPPPAPSPAAAVAIPVAAPVVSEVAASVQPPPETAPRPISTPPRPPSLRPSAAPWTREVAAANEADHDLYAAGVPRADAANMRRIGAVVAVAIAASALIVLRPWHAHPSTPAEPASENAGAAAETRQAGGDIPTQVPTVVIPAGEPSPLESAAAASEAAPLPAAPVTGGVPFVPAANPANGQERALDVKFENHSVSPLVRDAHRALLKGDVERATALAQQAVSTNPVDADGWLTLAAARKASGDLAGAGEAYRDCIGQAQTAGVMNCRALVARRERE